MIADTVNGLVFGTAFVGAAFFTLRRIIFEHVAVPSFLLLVLPPFILAAAVRDQSYSVFAAFVRVCSEYWFIMIALVIGYRLSPWHPLAAYPGPILCKISKLWLVYQLTQGRAFQYHRSLHGKYGDAVRIGPNELSFRHEGAVNPILKDLPKGPYFHTRRNGSIPQLDGMEDLSEYAIRRQAWNKGMGSAAVKDYEDVLKIVVRDLLEAFETREGQPLDLCTWLLYAAFDFTGDMAFSKQFNNVKDGKDTTGIIHAIGHGIMQVAWLGHVPWALPFVAWTNMITGGARSWQALQHIGADIVRTRMSEDSRKRDLAFWATKPSVGEVAVDGILAIIAGSDTVVVGLSQTFYFLRRHPMCMERLRTEIATYYPSSTDTTLDFSKQADMPYLNACINEAIRLYPPVLSGLQRRVETGLGGNKLGEYYVPDGTQVSVHLFTMQRDPRNFYPLSDEFWPDRFLVQDTYRLPSGQIISHDELIHHQAIFLPFSTGLRSCVGKNVAWLETRAVLCAILQKFDVSVAFGFDLDKWETSLRDQFVTTCGPLMVQFKARY